MPPIWNWKTALCSGLFRAPAFVAVSLRHGGLAAAQAGLAEFVLFASMVGFTGALVQRLRHLCPAWLARITILVVLPSLIHLCEFSMHSLLGSPARKHGLALSVLMTVISEAFSWHAMRNGALLAGREGDSLLRDLARMPALIGGFLLWIAGRQNHYVE
jgi:hypothetical protein